jgi:hypothetical protein
MEPRKSAPDRNRPVAPPTGLFGSTLAALRSTNLKKCPSPRTARGIEREAEAVLVRLSPTGTDTNEENVQAHRLKHGPSVLWQPHEPHLAILGVGEALHGK